MFGKFLENFCHFLEKVAQTPILTFPHVVEKGAIKPTIKVFLVLFLHKQKELSTF